MHACNMYMLHVSVLILQCIPSYIDSAEVNDLSDRFLSNAINEKVR